MVNTGATRSVYSQDKKAQARFRMGAGAGNTNDAAAQQRPSARNRRKAQSAGNAGHFQVQNMGGIVDEHHRHGGGAIRKALQHIFPKIVNRPIRIGIGLLIVMQCPQGLRRVQRDAALPVQQPAVFRKQPGHKLTGAHHHVADGHRGTILHRRGGIPAAGEKSPQCGYTPQNPGESPAPPETFQNTCAYRWGL